MNDWLYVPASRLTDAVVCRLFPYPGAVPQSRDVKELHVEVLQVVMPIFTDGVRLFTPKLAPETVNMYPPVEAPLYPTDRVTTGASYENSPKPVPTTSSCIAFTLTARPPPWGLSHLTYVWVDHEVVPQTVAPIMMLGVLSNMLNCVPTMERLPPADVGRLYWNRVVTTGASNEKAPESVPTTLSTVTETSWSVPSPYALDKHTIVLAAFQETVPHDVDPTLLDREKSKFPKFTPTKVTEAMPEVGPFGCVTCVTMG